MNSTIPELGDEQIESMRQAIMTDIGALSRAKTRRYRQIVAAAGTVIVLAGAGTAALISPDNSMPGSYSAAKAGSAERSTAGDAYGPQNALAGGGASSDSAGPSDRQQPGREIVTTGKVSMTAGTPRTAADKIIGYVESAGGRIDARNETSTSGHFGGRVTLNVRIPQDKVSTAIEAFRSYGKVDTVGIADQDVTTQGQDLDARIKALRVSVARLEAIMKDSKTTAELLKAETALSQRQANLDSLVAQRAGLSDQVRMSSLHIEIVAKDSADSVSASGFRGGVIDGWNGLVGAINGIVHGLGLAVPWALGIVVVIGLGWAIRRITGRSSRT